MKSLENILIELQNVKVIDTKYTVYVPIDLSETNTDIDTLQNSEEFKNYIEEFLVQTKSEIAYGGYIENRSLYRKSDLFNDNRNIHIGIDFWIKSGTKILAALDGKVHSFCNNLNKGDYGPTIILEHRIENVAFYTLYGHLSLESIATLQLGDIFYKGQVLATLGDSTVNGNYAPHLHFQIIKEIGTNYGDYPGVCNTSTLDYYLENCPDPNLLLKINEYF